MTPIITLVEIENALLNESSDELEEFQPRAGSEPAAARGADGPGKL